MNEENKQFIMAVTATSAEFGLFLVWTVISILWLLNRFVDSGQI